MPIKRYPDGTLVATEQDGMTYYGICSAIYVAKLASKGMRFRGNITIRALASHWNIKPAPRRWPQLIQILEDRRQRFLKDPNKKVSILTHGE